MPRTIAIDGSGRLVVPKDIRERHRLKSGDRLILIERDEEIVLRPELRGPRLVERDGLLVVSAEGPVEIPDHKVLREERLDRHSSRP